MTTQVTQDDLLDALRQALSQPAIGEGATVNELAESLRRSPESVRTKIKEMQKQGKVEVVKVRRINMAGTTSIVPAFRFLP